MEKYDSIKDTLAHQKRVYQLMRIAVCELLIRASQHDESKLEEPEKSIFDEWTPKLANTTYGSKEYDDMKKELQIALDHHYANNPHHPEYYKQGIKDMDLFDLFEMILDWKAATERHKDGDIYKSISINKERFNISDDLTQVFINTIKKMGF